MRNRKPGKIERIVREEVDAPRRKAAERRNGDATEQAKQAASDAANKIAREQGWL